MVEQAYYSTLISECVDMLYEAFSHMPTKKKCLMCARLYTLPSLNGMPSDDLNN
jgi:hypothetical protein